MKIQQCHWSAQEGWAANAPVRCPETQLVLAFGGRSVLGGGAPLDALRDAYPNAHLLGCSTSGEICGVSVSDDTLVTTAVHLEHSGVEARQIALDEVADSTAAGATLAGMLDHEGLRHVLVLSDGLNVNGSDLVKGLTQELPGHVTVTGGLSGDGADFQETLVLADGEPRSNVVAALGLYGDRLSIGYASKGGWDQFGPERVVTRSEGNVLYELDGRSALELYKEYLGEHASGLPATGLLFPLSLRDEHGDEPVMRTILGVDEESRSMTFAGDLPEGAYARLMRANFDRLVDGAGDAAQHALASHPDGAPDLAILISCVGRKMVLKQRVEEEVEAVRHVLGEGAVLTGFYSYGEISPFTHDARCQLHNQTMTITSLSER